MSDMHEGPDGGTFRPQAEPAGPGPPREADRDRRDIRAGTGVLILLIIVLFLSGALLLLRWLGVHALGPDRASSGRLIPPAGTWIAPGTEHLQKDPLVDRIAADRDAEQALSGYGWADPARGRARIPIELAMRLIANGTVQPPGRPRGAPAERRP